MQIPKVPKALMLHSVLYRHRQDSWSWRYTCARPHILYQSRQPGITFYLSLQIMREHKDTWWGETTARASMPCHFIFFLINLSDSNPLTRICNWQRSQIEIFISNMALKANNYLPLTGKIYSASLTALVRIKTIFAETDNKPMRGRTQVNFKRCT